jgi:uncharacterized RDD family membrane protein YckC
VGDVTDDRDRVDTSSLDPGMRYELHRRLSVAGVPFTQMRQELLVPARRGPWVEALMADVALEAVDRNGVVADAVDPLPLAPLTDPLARALVPGVGVPAARWRRFAGYVIDSTIFVLPSRVAVQAGAPSWVWFVALAVQGVVIVSMVASVGASPGKLAVGTRVVGYESGGRVGWSRSALRWLVAYAGFFLVVVAPWLAWLALLVQLANLGLVLFHPDGRAVNDLAAGTIVVEADGIESSRR